MLLEDEEGVVKAITHLPPEAGTMGGDPATKLKMQVSGNVRFHFKVCVSKNLRFRLNPNLQIRYYKKSDKLLLLNEETDGLDQ